MYLYLFYSSKSKDIRNLVKKKKKIREELDILFPPKNSSFQGKFLGIKLPNVSSISLVFTIYKFTAKLKQVERWGLRSSQGERQFQNEVFFSAVFCISLVLPFPED